MTLMEAKMNYIRAWQTLPEYGLTYFIIKLQGSKKEVCSMHCYNVIYSLSWYCLHWCKSEQLFLAKWGCQNSKTPEQIVQKFVVSDYVGDKTQQAQTQTDHPCGDVPANWWNIILTWFLIFLFFFVLFVTPIFARILRLNRITDFYAVWFIDVNPRLLHS